MPVDDRIRVTCPGCTHANPAANRFCAQCGGALVGPATPTRTSPDPPVAATPRQPSHGSANAERFLPGTMLAGRYRMVGLLGRGGMGEVYRADDLKLGQPVALKFLPRAVEQDPDRLERFINEVRLSLRVTHPNVCRVFDVAQADGRHFLSMEFVDGEDLASLLRRIGHLPEDKAIQIARQLCAGLAAAHDEGVLHRDLKPANVMIDGRGRAKITDFGLAGATAGIRGLEARAGTPQYMAPEQAAGGDLSERTDIYALGLVLHELFTGKRPSTPTNPTTFHGIDPAVERAIRRCLDADPAKRPPSAAALAAALPGGDPLGMALAAGETPSPEMVALAGGRGELSPAIAAICLTVVLSGLLATWFVKGRTGLENRVPMPLSPAELDGAARAIAGAAGYPTRTGYSAHGFLWMRDYFAKVERENHAARRWDRIASERPSPVRFWYRESPSPLTPLNDLGIVRHTDPPLLLPGMLRIQLDPDGVLQELLVVPPDAPDTTQTWPEPDWRPVLTATKSDPSTLVAAPPMWPAPVANDLRRAWTTGDHRIEAAAFRGRIVWLSVVPSWRSAREATSAAPTALADRVRVFIAITGIVVGLWLARRNLRLDRSDRRGATRVAAACVAAGCISAFLLFPGVSGVFSYMMNTVAVQFFYGTLVWVFYVALEPYVRRLWPDTLTAWTRLLEGRLRDPLVGRHILIGATAGILFTAVFWLPDFATAWAGLPPPAPDTAALLALRGFRFLISSYFNTIQGALFIPFGILLFILVLRVLLRKPWLAYATLVGFMTLLGPKRTIVDVVTTVLLFSLLVGVLTRLGVLALAVAIVFSTWAHVPLTTDTNSWFFATSALTMALYAAVAIYGFVVSLGGRLAFKDPVLDA